MSGVDYGLIALISLVTTFVGTFAKEIAEELIRQFRKARSKITTNGSKIRTGEG